MKTVKVWLCRNGRVNGRYVICPSSNTAPKRNDLTWQQRDKQLGLKEITCPAKAFERLFPHLKIKPGEGPRRIEITARFVD